MSRVLAVAACGIALAACAGQGDVMKTATPTIPLQFESEPAGAEVKTSGGQTCKTPCALAVPATDFMATYSLKGYAPLTVPVKLMPPDDPRGDAEINPTMPQARFNPNPVVAELQRAQPQRPAKKSPRIAQPRAQAPTQQADTPPPPMQQQQQQQQRSSVPPPSSASPWPPAANPIR